jgi:hypothetical protein
MRTLSMCLGVITAVAACKPEPPLPKAEPSRSVSARPATTVVSSPVSPAVEPAMSARAAASDRPPAEPPPVVEPALVDADGLLLPQTEDEPDVASPVFQLRLSKLFQAIVLDDADLARSFFFPLPAYEKVKAIAKPGRDWEKRLWKLFKRDVHDYHEQLGADPDQAELLGFEPRSERKKWMKPHTEGNAIGYFRMTRNTLRVRDARGKELALEITAVISWRGEWYVVHLHGFK